ncbi:hypothetical protein F5J12DRAFT_921176 [Pisolithus orientalis]|uniref:uncharacterized protein n=1 Tax=Pisolithus orientalis TaxID=936130 RepID=UPI0022247BFC|nr:uncharacterized protein F5J12DRAFT_921176 [Pisolithus orientalis]KAI6006646.1 hypothetical protein F5J12DRAFT_921176 [Pisolithus orientalis]
MTSLTPLDRKKAKYAAMRPPPLAKELALMQFADGGSRTIIQGRWGYGVSDVYRDGDGDTEEWEYAHLAGGSETGELQWVTFGGGSSPSALQVASTVKNVLTEDSDLRSQRSTPHCIAQPTDHLDVDDLATFGSAVSSLDLLRPVMSVLALPSRPRPTAKNLRKPDYFLDVAFPRVSLSPCSPKFGSSAFIGVGKIKRSTPLKLMPSSPLLERRSNSPGETDRERKEFLSSPFDHPIPATPTLRQTMLSLPLNKVVGKKSSILAMMGFFKPSRKDTQCLMH